MAAKVPVGERAVKRRGGNGAFPTGFQGASLDAPGSADYEFGSVNLEHMMMTSIGRFIVLAAIGTISTGATVSPVTAEILTIQQLLYREGALIASPVVQIEAGNGASAAVDLQAAKIRTTITPRPGTASSVVTVSTVITIFENGRWSDLGVTDLTGGIGAGATTTMHSKVGATYRLISDIRSGAEPTVGQAGN